MIKMAKITTFLTRNQTTDYDSETIQNLINLRIFLGVFFCVKKYDKNEDSKYNFDKIVEQIFQLYVEQANGCNVKE